MLIFKITVTCDKTTIDIIESDLWILYVILIIFNIVILVPILIIDYVKEMKLFLFYDSTSSMIVKILNIILIFWIFDAYTLELLSIWNILEYVIINIKPKLTLIMKIMNNNICLLITIYFSYKFNKITHFFNWI